MICCWLRACHVRSLHKGTALLRRFCMRRLHLTFSCAADRLCRAARSSRRRCWIVWHCIWSSCHSGRSALCIRRLHKGAALLRRLALHRPSLRIAAVIRFSCAAGWLTGTARRILACRFSCRTERNCASVILYRCAAARIGFRLGMYGLLLLHILHDRAARAGLRSSCGMIRRAGRGFCCCGCSFVLWRCYMTRRTSGAGRNGCFAGRVWLLADPSRCGLRERVRCLFGGRLYGICLRCSGLRGNRFLSGYSACTILLRRCAVMIGVCMRSRIAAGCAASAARARSGRCIWLGISAAAARLIAVPADGMRCIGHH